MQITSSVGQPTTFSKISQKPNTPVSSSARLTEPDSIASIDQQQASNKKTQSAIRLDEKALALFKENQASQLSASQNIESRFSAATQDQPLAKNKTAVASYQAIGNQAQRESVEQLFGVDLFA